MRIQRLRVRLDRFEHIFVLGGGKATGAMAVEVETLLGDRITDGVVNVPDYLRLPGLKKIRPHRATHPLPTAMGAEGVREMLKLAERATNKDLYLCLFSGGGSALMPAPADGLNLEDKVTTTNLLLKSGADIGEMNIVRKHLSSFKGGRLAENLGDSTVVSLVISDVPGDRIDTVSSGPTAPDATTFAEARKVLQKYHVWTKVPPGVRDLIRRGEVGKVSETPKPGSSVFRRVHNVLIGSNWDARQAAWAYLKSMGVRARLKAGFYQGEARDVGESLMTEFLRMKRGSSQVCALVAGGEATVTVLGRGLGGRDQELALSAARFLKEEEVSSFAALATDGIDGPTRAAGAIADNSTLGRGGARGLDLRNTLRENDSNTYFRRLGDLLIAGPTGTNVNDIVVALALHSDKKHQW